MGGILSKSIHLFIIAVLLNGIPILGFAQELKLKDLLPGIVKIIGKNRIGSGLIVKITTSSIFILTASHVVLAEPNPKVLFYGQSTPAVEAQVEFGSELNDEDRGLALLRVGKKSQVNSQPRELPLAIEDPKFTGGETIEVIGLPREADDWVVLHGNWVSRRGRDLIFDVGIDEGTSGGAIIYKGKVIGLVQRKGSQFGIGNPVESLWGFMRGMRSLSNLVSEKNGPFSVQMPTMPLELQKEIKEANGEDELFDALVATLENISNDYYSLVAFKHGITRLKKGVNSSQLSKLISTASIGDDYYCSQAIIAGARYLVPPIKSEDIKAILSTVNSAYYHSEAAKALMEEFLKEK